MKWHITERVWQSGKISHGKELMNQRGDEDRQQSRVFSKAICLQVWIVSLAGRMPWQSG